MLSKIALNKVACFKKPTFLETDKKINLIYGLNGTGKSTLSNFLYKSGDSKFKDCSIDGLDNAELIVYNQSFIQEQFFESENLKGIFTLSKTNKDAEVKIINAEKEIKKIELEIAKKNLELEKTKENIATKQLNAKTKVWEIKTNYSGGDRVLEFCLEGYKSDGNKLLTHVESLKKPITKPSKTIDELKEEVQALAGENAQKYTKLNIVSFTANHIENDELLQKKIVGNENSTVGEFINKLANSDWVRDGLQYLPSEIPSTNEDCPFCQEKTISQDLFDSIKGYFDESYENDLNKLKSFKKEYSEAIIGIPDKSIFESNPKFESFKKDFEIKYAKLIKILSSNEKLIVDKVKSPSLPVTLESSKNAIEELVDIINNVNKLTDAHNKRIDNKAAALTELKGLFWQMMRWDYDQTISSLISDRKNSETSISEILRTIGASKVDIQNQEKIIIDQQKQTVNIEEAIANINNALIDLGIDEFKIIKYSDGLYKIARADINLNIFHSLSEGEKMIISFLYFLESCKGKKNATDTGKKKIVVIDDPISSLSHIYVFNVGRLIHNEFLRSDKYEQIFILTHSLYFFYELTDTNPDRRKETQKLFRIRKNATGSDILEMKYEEIQNDYHSYWFIIKDDKQPPSLIANCMRNIIEYFFTFVEKKDLNNVFQKAELQSNRFSAFNRYINRESHSLGQNIFDIKEFNYPDFKDAFELVFKISGYEDHYKKMTK
jgi:wobble nucleotide-excising tRNase